MPIYEYECKKCGAHVEALQKVNDKPLTKCGKCRGKLERKISAAAIQFKGTGWYVTDYAGKNSPTSEKSGSKTEKGGSAESTSSSDSASKPAGDTKPAATGGGSKSGSE